MSSTTEIRSSDETRVVIVGGGFAGFHCAQQLSSDPTIRVTLIDKHNYQAFQPLLYQVGTGILSPHNAAFNLRTLLYRRTNVDVKMSEIVSVNLATRTARGKSGDVYQGDYLVLAAGAEANFLEVPGAEDHAFPLYSLRDAEKLRYRLIEICEAAELHNDGSNQDIQVVIVGGGATGVEVAGALIDLMEGAPRHLFRNVDLGRGSVTIVDSGNTVLGPFKEQSQKYVTATLRARGVKFYFGAHVEEVTQKDVLLSDGKRIPSTVVIWAGGLKAARLSGALTLTAGKGGRVDVQPDLSVPGSPGVYALGDFSNCNDSNGHPLPQLGSVAKQAGRHCAKNILAAIKGKPQEPFHYFDTGIMAMVGRNSAVAEIGQNRLALAGPLAFVAWLAVHVLLLNTFRVKVQTVFEWLSEYFGKVNVATILDNDSQEPEAGRKTKAS